jgi:hypothetical protein
MFKNHIKEAIKLNQINLENVQGIKLYYSKLNICLRLIVLLIPLISI